MTKEKALAMYLDVDEKEITKSPWNTYGIKNESEEYLVLTEDEADKEAKAEIKESLWAFKAEFILQECGMDISNKVENSLIAMQKACCEDCNDFILALIEGSCGLDKFVDDAIGFDGRGHFISEYDGEEVDAEGEYYIYRVQ